MAIALLFMVGICIGFAGNVWIPSAQNIVPQRMRGRYFAFDGLIGFIGGLMVLVFGIVPVYELSGALLLVFVVAFSLFRSQWKLGGSKISEVSS